MQNDIYNFIKLDDKNMPNVTVFLTELNQPQENDVLMQIGHKFYQKLLSNDSVNKDTLVIMSFIKHFSKSIKSLTFIRDSNDNKLNKFTSLNSLIAAIIIKNEDKSKLENFIVYEKENSYDKEISIHSINSQYSIQGYNKYFS
ncbi:hypothetical protein CPAV1605_1295 [seawater metagenome]|uniref:Uncharacterized protein n=1 Tax=seawater metagenome TaxID=1561972 RepID=A0A5E8CL35_9ZZZZ